MKSACTSNAQEDMQMPEKLQSEPLQNHKQQDERTGFVIQSSCNDFLPAAKLANYKSINYDA